MIDQDSRRTAGDFLHCLLDCILFFLARGIWASFVSRKVVKTFRIAKICFHSIEHWPFILELLNTHFAERQQIVRDETPDKHRNSTKNTREKDTHIHRGERMGDKGGRRKKKSDEFRVPPNTKKGSSL